MSRVSERSALIVLCAASFLAVVDTTIVSVALPRIRAATGLDLVSSQWVLNAYALPFGGLLLLSGRLGDRFGRRRAFAAGLIVFGVGSVIAGCSGEAWSLLAGRVVQGVGAAAFVPNSLSLVTMIFREPGPRSRALAAYGAMAGIGFVTGMVGGGVITELFGWPWIFLINVPIVLIMLGASRSLPAARDGSRGPIDVWGGLLATGGLTLLIFMLGRAAQHGWFTQVTVIAGLAAVALLVALVAVERRHPDPLLPFPVLRRRTVAVPNGAIVLQSMIGVGWLYLLTSYLQDGLRFTTLVSGLVFAPMTLASIAGAAAAGRLVPRIGVRRTALLGLVGLSAGVTAMGASAASSTHLPLMITAMVIGETGFMIGSVSLTIAATSGIEQQRSGLAAGLINTSTQLGAGVGLGLVAAAVATAPADQLGTGLQTGFAACLIFALAAMLLAFRLAEVSQHSPVDRAGPGCRGRSSGHQPGRGSAAE